MKIRKRVTASAVAAITSVGIALSGVGLVSPAEAAQQKGPVLTETDYGFQATAYGTRVQSDVAALDSTRLPFSYLSCTRLAGRKDSRSLASVQLPANDPYIDVQTVDSHTRSYRDKAHGVDAAITGITNIGKVKLGNSSTPQLTINNLRTQSIAWATNRGKLKTSNEISSGNISLANLPSDVPPELQALIDAANGGINDVLQALEDNGGAIEIPGLGMVSLGFDRQVTKKNWAAASSFVLRVNLYGPDGVQGGGDDSLVGIGRSWARINRDLPAGVMGGFGFGANAQLLDGVVKEGRLGEQPLRCRGTDGKVRVGPVAGIDLGGAGQIQTSGLQGRAFGVQHDSGRARAWTEGSVADVNLGGGSLEIKGIVGRANVKQNKAGKIVKRNIKGSTIGEIIVNGESQGSFDPATAGQIPPLEVPGVAKIEFFKKQRTKRGMRVSAVVITLADGSPGLSVIRLGNAQLHIKRY